MDNARHTIKGIIAGFCSLLFGGAATIPYAISPRLDELYSTFQKRSTAESFALDQHKLAQDLQNAITRLADDQTQAG
jgi:hypothetical protein